jgi:hypothetical protein
MARIKTAADELEQQRRDHAPGGLISRDRAKSVAAALPPRTETEKDPRMRKQDIWPSKYLKADDLPEARTVTIKSARMETLKNKNGEDEKLAIFFKELSKPLIMNRVNFDVIAGITGEDNTDNWIGHKITLYPTTTQMNGEEVACIRVKTPATAATAKPAVAKAKPTAKKKPIGEDLDDAIGF